MGRPAEATPVSDATAKAAPTAATQTEEAPAEDAPQAAFGATPPEASVMQGLREAAATGVEAGPKAPASMGGPTRRWA